MPASQPDRSSSEGKIYRREKGKSLKANIDKEKRVKKLARNEHKLRTRIHN